MQQTVRTMRQGYVDYKIGMQRLCKAVHRWESDSFDALAKALKEGRMGKKEIRYTDLEIAQMNYSKTFKTKYRKHLMLQFHGPETMAMNLAKFHCDFKVESSNPSKPARGQRDPTTNKTLFMAEAKVTIEEQKRMQ